MRGRAQAVAVAALGVISLLFSWVSAAVVGLVTLRRGAGQGLIVLAWALLPALAVGLWGRDIGPITALIGTTAAAVVLRGTVSWPYALVTASLCGLLTSLIVHTLASGYVEQLLAMLGELFEQLRSQMPADQAQQLMQPTAAQVSGLLGFGATSSAVAGLLLARWWQALLYNPGGFREEFHRLRLPLVVAGGLVAALGLTGALGGEYRFWALIFAVPFVVAGFGLIHGVAAIKGWGRGLLVVVYLGWLLTDWVKFAMFAAAVIDSIWDIRARMRAGQSGT